ncbi:hypothetical protein TRSC58_06446 [Trypanosoma rangeli SC58]|uniref:Uncharacterized protein n=1 Tax=Trypanosoma rangeli SC58 TaxID=429131 RepID=A0A061ITI7_TRYRA|nr:hypothetical protein TRSC58_06446 [Trypanosoma rangeli SC58]
MCVMALSNVHLVVSPSHSFVFVAYSHLPAGKVDDKAGAVFCSVLCCVLPSAAAKKLVFDGVGCEDKRPSCCCCCFFFFFPCARLRWGDRAFGYRAWYNLPAVCMEDTLLELFYFSLSLRMQEKQPQRGAFDWKAKTRRGRVGWHCGVRLHTRVPVSGRGVARSTTRRNAEWGGWVGGGKRKNTRREKGREGTRVCAAAGGVKYMSCRKSWGKLSADQRGVAGNNAAWSSTTPAAALRTQEVQRDVRGARCSLTSTAAAEEFKMRSSVRKTTCGARSSTACGGALQKATEATECFGAKTDFNLSHRELLGRCWETTDVERLTNVLARNVPKNVHETLSRSSFALPSKQRGGRFSTAAFLPDVHTVELLTSPDGRTSRSARSSTSSSTRWGIQKRSHWVSLIQIPPPGATQKSIFFVPKKSGGGAHEKKVTSPGSLWCGGGTVSGKLRGSCRCLSRLLRVMCQKNNNVDFVIPAPDTDVAECGYAGAKNTFAYRLIKLPSKEKNTAFLRKHGLSPCFGTCLHRWDRVDFFSPNIHLLALAASLTQPKSVTGPLAHVLSCYSPLIGGNASLDAGGASVSADERAKSVVLVEGFSCVPPQTSTESADFAERPSRFPEESLYCHCLAFFTNYLQELQAGAESLQSTTLTSVVSSRDVENMLEGTSGHTDGHPLQASSVHLGSFVQKSIDCNASASTLAANAPATPSCLLHTESDVQKMASGAPESASFSGRRLHSPFLPDDVGNGMANVRSGFESCQPPAPKTVLSSVVVSSFELFIDLVNWKKRRYSRSVIPYGKTTSSIRRKYGEGIVTRVMYGGVLVVECSDHMAAQNLEMALKKEPWLGKKKNLAASRETNEGPRGDDNTDSRRNAERTLPSADCIRVGSNNDLRFSGGVQSDDSKQLGSYRVVYYVGGERESSWASDSNVQRQPSTFGTVSAHTGHYPLTPWLGLEKMVELASSWARRLLSNPKLVEPIAVYVQRFAGIIPFLYSPYDRRKEPDARAVVTPRGTPREVLSSSTASICVADDESPASLIMAVYTPSAPSVRNTCRPMSRSVVDDAHLSASTLTERTPITPLASHRPRSIASKPPLTESLHGLQGADLGRDVMSIVREESNSTHISGFPSEKDDGEAIWEICMLEATALEAELKMAVSAAQEAEEEYSRIMGIVHSMQQAFLPNSQLEQLESICTYLVTLIYEAEEIPEQDACIGGPDWFPCLAAVLTNPHHSLHGINILYRLDYGSSPQLGMLAGLFYHEHAMASITRLILRCGIFFAEDDPANSLDYFEVSHQNIALWKIMGRLSSRGVALPKLYFLCLSMLRADACRRGPPFFLTRQQLRGVLFTLLGSIVENNQQPQFTLQLTDNGDHFCKRRLSKTRRFFGAISGILKCRTTEDEGGNSHGNDIVGGDADWLQQEDNAVQGRKRDSFWTRMPEVELVGEEQKAVKRAWAEAERRPFCMLLRHRESVPPIWSVPYGACPHDTHHEQDDVGQAFAEERPWVYGLESTNTQLAAIYEFSVDAFLHSHFIVEEMQKFIAHCSKRGSSGKEAKGGNVAAKKRVTLLM